MQLDPTDRTGSRTSKHELDEPPVFEPPETFNIAEYFLGDRLREGLGDRRALVTDEGELTYAQLDELVNRYGNLLLRAGVRPEERVLIALPDGPGFVAALFGALRIGAVAVMLNPHLKPDEIDYFFRYTRGAVLFVAPDRAPFFREVTSRSASRSDATEGREAGAVEEPWGPGISAPRETFVVGGAAFVERLAVLPGELETFPTHRDDAAIWLFSGGTTGKPKAVVQTHASFANTTECYGKHVLGLTENDVTLSVPKLFFGYATGSNLFFPFAVGATAALFPDRCTADVLFEKIEKFRPTVLVNVPTMINQMLTHPGAATRDLSSLRLTTSAGEALPAELHRRWDEAYGTDLLDGLGTAEMWHIFLSSRPGDVHPGTLGKAVPGFEVRVCDRDGGELADGEIGWLWVRGRSRALGYWQQADKTAEAFRGRWYVSGDMVVRDASGVFTYCGRGDDMLKVKGKWLSPREVENCLLQHPDVVEAAVVGVKNKVGLVEPIAWVIPVEADLESDSAQVVDDREDSAKSLQRFVTTRLASYKAPAAIHLVRELPRTHLGKVDRAALRAESHEGGD